MKEIERLKGELKACRERKDTPIVDTKRQEALAALRAVQSSVAAGANVQEFKKYQLESRVKVDALPETPENTPLREVAELYRDATSLLIDWQLGEMKEDEAAYFRSKYGNDSAFMQLFSFIPKEGFDSDSMLKHTYELSAKYSGSYLIDLAKNKLDAIH